MSKDDDLVDNIRTWLEYERKIKSLQAEVRQLRKSKKELTEQLTLFMRDNEVDCFDVKDGKIIYSKRTVRGPLNKKTLHVALQQFFSNRSEDLSAETLEFLMASRPETVHEQIRLKDAN